MDEESSSPKQTSDSFLADLGLSLLFESTIGCVLYPIVAIVLIVGAIWFGGIAWLGYSLVVILVLILIAIIAYIVRQATTKS